MKITEVDQQGQHETGEGEHLLLVAEDGFSMLDIYARGQCGIDTETIREFAHQVNRTNESGSLHPAAPISAVPRKYFRELANTRDEAVLAEFKQHITEFLEANEQTIRASQVIIDFHVDHDPVPESYITATSEVLRSALDDSILDEVVILR